MAKYELVKFVDPNDGWTTVAQFTDDRTKVAVYNSEQFGRENFGNEPFFDSVDEVLEYGDDGYAAAVKAALETGQVIATKED